MGLVEGKIVRDVTLALNLLPSYRYPLPSHDVLIENLDQILDRVGKISRAAPELPLDGLKLRSPVANPGKIIAAPVNYQKHLDEVKGDAQLHQNTQAHTITIQKAGLFLKANSSLVGPGEGIALRHLDRRNDHEVELAVVMGKDGRVAGYSIGLDITIRGTEDRSFRKSPDSYTVLGPWLVTPDEVAEPGNLDLEIAVNGETRQKSNTKYMILGVPELIQMASSFYTLHPGDIISTGTPQGVGLGRDPKRWLKPGEEITIEISSIGKLVNKTVAGE